MPSVGLFQKVVLVLPQRQRIISSTSAQLNRPLTQSNVLLNKFAGEDSRIGDVGSNGGPPVSKRVVEKKGPKMRSLELKIFFLPFLAIAVNICGVAELVKIAKAKGHYTDGAGILWFIGLFGTALMVGLIVCSLPDRAATASIEKNDEDALPEV